MNALPQNLESTIKAIFTDDRVTSNTVQQHEWEMRAFLQLVLNELAPERTVELGTYKGWTTAMLSLVTSRHTVSIDIQDYGTAESYSYGQNLTFLVEDATTPDCVTKATMCLGGPIDLLFIDDGHYYETICREFELWKSHVRPGGWIVFHDINDKANIGPHGIQPDCIQVPRFWSELKGNKQEIVATPEHAGFRGVIPHGGLGILRT